MVEFDRSVLGNVKYGLFNVHEWKDKLTVVLYKKIDEFDLNVNNRGEIHKKMDQLLYKIIEEGENIISDRISRGNLLTKFKSVLAYVVIDFTDLRKRVPQLTNDLINDLADEKTMRDMKGFLKLRLSEYLDQTIVESESTIVLQTLNKYGFQKSQKEEAFQKLGNDIERMESKLWEKGIILIIIAFAIFFHIWFQTGSDKLLYVIGIATTAVLLIGGILTPMIDLDARITSINFTLMNEPINFSEQILFYQSKSILDVFWVLFQSNLIQNVVISILIVLSVLFFRC